MGGLMGVWGNFGEHFREFRKILHNYVDGSVKTHIIISLRELSLFMYFVFTQRVLFLFQYICIKNFLHETYFIFIYKFHHILILPYV